MHWCKRHAHRERNACAAELGVECPELRLFGVHEWSIFAAAANMRALIVRRRAIAQNARLEISLDSEMAENSHGKVRGREGVKTQK
jgi:hypothetical protein